jgi:hypothetical protein
VKVLVYVEGPSDRTALEEFLEPIISTGRKGGVGIRLLPLNGKAPVLNDSWRKAADHLADNPADWVFALPDLYPMSVYDGTPNAHKSFADLERLLKSRFDARANKIGVDPAARSHFRVHCLKHDLEGLLLAAPDALRLRLGTKDAIQGRWRKPVEDQNDDRPPKRVVEALFDQYRKKPKYIDTTDAPWILKRASLEAVIGACSQRFAPFVAELRALADGGEPP